MVDQLYSKPYKDTFYLDVQFPDKHIKLEFNISEELFKNFLFYARDFFNILNTFMELF